MDGPLGVIPLIATFSIGELFKSQCLTPMAFWLLNLGLTLQVLRICIFLLVKCFPNLTNSQIRHYFLTFTISKILLTLPAEMFGGSDFWLETRVIIKISKRMIPHIKPKVFVIRKKQKTFFFKKRKF